MKLNQIMVALDYKISGGSEYGWKCYPDARYIDFESDYATVSVVYSTQDQTVYEVGCYPNEGDDYYRWQDSAFKEKYITEAVSRGFTPDIAIDKSTWIDLETETDCLEKIAAVFNNIDFDKRIEVPLELSDGEFLRLAKIAHERGITFNDLVIDILQQVVNNVDE